MVKTFSFIISNWKVTMVMKLSKGYLLFEGKPLTILTNWCTPLVTISRPISYYHLTIVLGRTLF